MKSKERDIRSKDDIEYYFSFNKKLLSLIGLKSNNKNAKNVKFKEILPTILTNIQGIIIVTIQIFYLLDVYSNDVTLGMQIISQIIGNFLCISKGFLISIANSHVQTAFDSIKAIWNEYRPSDDLRVQILSTADRTLLFCKFYFAIINSNVIIYGTPSLVNFLIQYRHRETLNHTYDFRSIVLVIKYPFEISNIPIYFSIFFEEIYLLILSGLFWYNSDTLFAQLITHICLQFKVLKHDIEAAFNNESLEDYSKLINFVRRLEELLRICKLIEDIFSPIIFAIILLSAISLCINLLEVEETISRGYYQEFGKYVFICVSTLFQILIYCTLAESLTLEAGSLAETVYNCEWTSKNRKLKFYVYLTIMTAQKPIYCTAYGFFPVGHKQLTAIINASLTYYMLLQTMS